MIKECKEFVKNLTPKTGEKNVIVKGDVRISVLTDRLLRIEEANLIVDEGIIKVKPEALKVNDIVLITAGETIPVDGEIIEVMVISIHHL